MALRALQNQNKLVITLSSWKIHPWPCSCYIAIFLYEVKSLVGEKSWDVKDSSRKAFPKRIFNDYTIQTKNPSKETQRSDDILLDLIVTYSDSPAAC